MKRRLGIYLVPNLFTTGALFFGFDAIILAINQRFDMAAIAIFVAMVLDGLDGRVARLTETQSDFGVQYDSLSDMISFGLAPALVVYQWGLSTVEKLGWLAAFFYTAATALRLARFNAQIHNEDKRFFQGLPSPVAAALLAGFVWIGDSYQLTINIGLVICAFILTLGSALLMVSNFRFHSFKQIDLRGRTRFVIVLAIVLIFALIAIAPPLVLFLMVLVYILSGLLITLVSVHRRRAARKLS